MPVDNFFCRKATMEDDVKKIARYLYETDPYIYPTICESATDEDWVRFVHSCMEQKNNVYSVEHMWIIEDDKEILGVACIVPGGAELTLMKEVNVPSRLFSGLQTVVEGYYTPLIRENKELTGYNIVNLCIDAGYRGKGLGRRLLAYCIGELRREIHLDVIAANKGAIRLYQEMGFVIQSEYVGFSGSEEILPCFHMTRG